MKRKRKDPLDKINQLNLTPEQREALLTMLSAEGAPNAMLKMLDVAMAEFVRAEFAKHIGAELHERTDERRDQRNGSRTRALHALLGSMVELGKSQVSELCAELDGIATKFRATADLRERFSDSLKKAMAIFDAGVDDALAFLAYPGIFMD